MSRALAGRSTRRQGNGAAERVQAMVEEKLDQGLEYEALQLIKGQAARKAARGDYDAAAALAETGAQTLMQRHFADSAFELCRQLVEVYKEHGCEATEERLDRIRRLDVLYTQAAKGGAELKGKGSEAGRAQARKLHAKFLKAAVAWTAAVGQRPNGDAELNALLGRALFAMGSYEAGAARMVIGERPIELVDLVMAADFSRASDADDEENGGSGGAAASPQQQQRRAAENRYAGAPPALVRERLMLVGVLHFLSLGNLRDANAARAAWAAEAPDGEARNGQRFALLLCKTCEHDAAPMFTRLADAMRSTGDPAVDKHLAQIGRVFFSILPPPNMLDSILKMLGAG